MIRTLYKKLVCLYPQAFRDQLGESMTQSFNDLYNERKRQPASELFRFTLWTFIDTALGIAREHLLSMRKGNSMKNMFLTLRSPALMSLLLVVPFMIMELVNRRGFNEGFPFPLFIMMWLLPLIFILAITPMIRSARAGNSLIAQPVRLLLRVVVLVSIASMWISLLIDQMPCFLGMPNCD